MIIFLGGTCNQSTWREKLIPNLAVDYFNPVVDYWDEQCYERELIARETADFCLFVITPKIEGLFALAEVIDTSYKRTDRTIYCFLEEDGDDSFTVQQLEVLENIGKRVEANGAVWLKSLDDIAEFFRIASQIQPPASENEIYDVFISYGRRHSKSFAIQLRQSLIDQGYRVWLDTENIAIAVEFQQKIDEGIRYSHNFCFILSPHSVNSEYCNRELRTALALNKRIIPIYHMDMGASEGDIPEKLKKLNWMMFHGENTYTHTLSSLVLALNQQTALLHPHCDLLLHADQWVSALKSPENLLYGQALIDAREWLINLKRAKELEVFPLVEHTDYINASWHYHQDEMADVCLIHHSNYHDLIGGLSHELVQRGYVVSKETLDAIQSSSVEKLLYKRLRTATYIVLLASEGMSDSSVWKYIHEYVNTHDKVVFTLLENLTPERGSDLGQIIRFDKKAGSAELCELMLPHLEIEKSYLSLRNKLFCRAIQWRERQSDGILLTSTELVDYQQFLVIAKTRPVHSAPTALVNFVEESERVLETKADHSVDFFICADVEDDLFAVRLRCRLRELDRTVHYYEHEHTDRSEAVLNEMLAASCRIIVVLPRVQSDCVDKLMALAKGQGKPITFIKLKRFRQSVYHEKYQALEQNAFEVDELLEMSLTHLLSRLSGNTEHLEAHRYWSQKCFQWKEQKFSVEFLLGSSESILAEAWLESAMAHKNEPLPSEQLIDFIHTSSAHILQVANQDKRNKTRLKLFSLFSFFMCCVAIFLGVNAYQDAQLAQQQTASIQRKNKALEQKTLEANLLAQQAELARNRAQEKQQLAIKNSEIAKQQTRLAQREKENAENQKALALALKVEAEQAKEEALLNRQEAESQARAAYRLQQIAEIESQIYQAQIQDSDAHRVKVALDAYQSLKSLNASTNDSALFKLFYEEVKSEFQPISAHSSPVKHLVYDPDSTLLLSVDSQNILVVHDLSDLKKPRQVFQFQLQFSVKQLKSHSSKALVLSEHGKIFELSLENKHWFLTEVKSPWPLERLLLIDGNTYLGTSNGKLVEVNKQGVSKVLFDFGEEARLFVSPDLRFVLSQIANNATLWERQEQVKNYNALWETHFERELIFVGFINDYMISVDALSAFRSVRITKIGEELFREGKAHQHPLSKVLFVNEKRFVVSISIGGSIKYWPFDGNSTNPSPIEIQHEHWVYSATHISSAAHSYIYIGTDTGHIVPLPLEIDELVKLARAALVTGKGVL